MKKRASGWGGLYLHVGFREMMQIKMDRAEEEDSCRAVQSGFSAGNTFGPIKSHQAATPSSCYVTAQQKLDPCQKLNFIQIGRKQGNMKTLMDIEYLVSGDKVKYSLLPAFPNKLTL